MSQIKAKSFQIKDESNGENSQLNILSKQNYIFCLSFTIWFLIIDIALLVDFIHYFTLIAPKLGVHILTIATIIGFRKRITNLQTNNLMFISKAISLLFIILLGEEYVLIIAFVLNHSNPQVQTFGQFIQKSVIMLSCFIIMIIKFNLVFIFIMASILCQEILQIILLKTDHQTLSTQRSIQISKHSQDLISSKENIWLNRMSTVQLCYIMISMDQLTITYRNQNFYNLFSSVCKSEEEFDTLILQKMVFQILSENTEQIKLNCKADQRKENFFPKYPKITSPNSESYAKNCKYFSSQKLTLTQIIQTVKLLYNKVDKTSATLSLDFSSQYFWEDNKFSTFTGQILLNEDDDEVMLTLIDVSKQNKLQEEKIKDQFKTSIIQSFSHELRTPLNSSLNFLQYCVNDKSINDEIKNTFISPAINALRLQSYLINDIIDFSSLCNNNLELNINQIPFEQIVDEVNRLFKSVLDMKNLVLFIDLTKNEFKTIGTDFSRLIQILANLISNSIKYSNKGAIFIKFRSKAQNQLKITIQDEGMGITDEKLRQIKQILQYVEQKKNFSEHSSWHGFGLLISSLLLQKLKPENQELLKIKSEGTDKGTKFTFHIQNHLGFNQNSDPVIKDQQHRIIQIRSSLKPVNGTLIQINESPTYQSKQFEILRDHSRKLTYQAVKSCNVSAISESLIDVDFELQIGDFYNLYPFIFSDQSNQITYEQQLSKNLKQLSKFLSYEQLKLQEEQESEIMLKKLLDSIRCTCRKILSVDDEIFNQKSLQFLLGQYGFEVILAFNGEEALKVAAETPKCSENCNLFLLILMDYQMPIMNGLKATTLLKEMMKQEKIPQIPIVGLTAFNSTNDIEQCLNSGMSVVLTKPLIIAELFEIMKST